MQLVSRWSLVAWAAVLGGCAFIPGGAVLTAVYCGSDWEAPCELHTTAAYWTAGVLVAIPVVVAVAADTRTRTRWLITVAIAAAPLHWWFLTGYVLSAAAESPL